MAHIGQAFDVVVDRVTLVCDHGAVQVLGKGCCQIAPGVDDDKGKATIGVVDEGRPSSKKMAAKLNRR